MKKNIKEAISFKDEKTAERPLIDLTISMKPELRKRFEAKLDDYLERTVDLKEDFDEKPTKLLKYKIALVYGLLKSPDGKVNINEVKQRLSKDEDFDEDSFNRALDAISAYCREDSGIINGGTGF